MASLLFLAILMGTMGLQAQGPGFSSPESGCGSSAPGTPADWRKALGQLQTQVFPKRFESIQAAIHNAFDYFLRACKKGKIDAKDVEYFSYIYCRHGPSSSTTFYFRSKWAKATYFQTATNSEQYKISDPLAGVEQVEKCSMIHSHPSNRRNGEGPSRIDVALASTYKDSEGHFSYLYLVNNRKILVRFKAIRNIDPTDPRACARMPFKPVRGRDYLD